MVIRISRRGVMVGGGVFPASASVVTEHWGWGERGRNREDEKEKEGGGRERKRGTGDVAGTETAERQRGSHFEEASGLNKDEFHSNEARRPPRRRDLASSGQTNKPSQQNQQIPLKA